MNRSHPRLARYRATLATGADAAVVTQWINDTQHDKRTTLARLKEAEAQPTAASKKEKPLTEKEILEIAKDLREVTQRLQSTDPSIKASLYEALGVTISYENATRAATVRSRPSKAHRQAKCPRGDLNPHAR
ncbi:hypothetical protein [Streptomyces sp. F001]|uniref:hypothetical protein n=1 Tax=Streptomyces sp. F001 TaxID=1510026 RepID=UPI00101E7767|nr:hypothetical protein [Streptomyces sp. F001]